MSFDEADSLVSVAATESFMNHPGWITDHTSARLAHGEPGCFASSSSHTGRSASNVRARLNAATPAQKSASGD